MANSGKQPKSPPRCGKNRPWSAFCGATRTANRGKQPKSLPRCGENRPWNAFSGATRTAKTGKRPKSPPRCGENRPWSAFCGATRTPNLGLLKIASLLNYIQITAINEKPSPKGWFFAVRKGLEPSTSGVTGRHSNQLNYRTRFFQLPVFAERDCKGTNFFLMCKYFFNFFALSL